MLRHLFVMAKGKMRLLGGASGSSQAVKEIPYNPAVLQNTNLLGSYM
jgi:hypothetical protein